MKKEIIYRALVMIILASFTFGFRVFTTRWDIKETDPTLWIRHCDTTYKISDLTSLPTSDPIQGSIGASASELSSTTPISNTVTDMEAVLYSIAGDYNSIQGSFAKLELYPTSDDQKGLPTNADWDSHKAETRTIDICEGSPGFGKGGVTKFKTQGGKLVGCNITYSSKTQSDIKNLLQTLTHEIGHCMGLDHPQDTRKSVMSYFSNSYRLQPDDRAGVAHLYPKDVYGVNHGERDTLGLSCTFK